MRNSGDIVACPENAEVINWKLLGLTGLRGF
jgi:hypothetical protein